MNSFLASGSPNTCLTARHAESRRGEREILWVVGITGDGVRHAHSQQRPGALLGIFAEPAGDRLGGDLQQAASRTPRLRAFEIAAEIRIAFGVCDDRDDAGCDQSPAQRPPSAERLGQPKESGPAAAKFMRSNSSLDDGVQPYPSVIRLFGRNQPPKFPRLAVATPEAPRRWICRCTLGVIPSERHRSGLSWVMRVIEGRCRNPRPGPRHRRVLDDE